MDRIHIKDLMARCIIGVNEDERREKQDIVINITMCADLRAAGMSDRFEDAVDYRAVKKKVIAAVEPSKFYLIEALAKKIAAVVLENPKVIEVTVMVEKPAALRFARTVGVEITRKRQ